MNAETEIHDVEKVIEDMVKFGRDFQIGPYEVTHTEEHSPRTLRDYAKLSRQGMKNEDIVELQGDFFASLVESYGAVPAE